MIGVMLRGGLGNQLFQYVAGRAVADRHGTTLRLSARALPRERTPRAYHLDRLAGVPRRTLTEVGVALAVRGLVPGVTVVEDPEVPLDSARLLRTAPNGSLLLGYWQGAANVDVFDGDVRDLFQPPQTPGPDPDAVRVHVRRGDYVPNPNFNVLTSAYYRGGVDHLDPTGRADVVVVTDDPDWCRAELDLGGRPMEVVSSPDPVDDFDVLRTGRRLVIANSTFSWWAARLAPPGAEVVAPRTSSAIGFGASRQPHFHPDHWHLR